MMPHQTLWLVFAGCLLGAAQLVAGLVIGIWVRRSARPRAGGHDLLHASLVAKRLHTLADEMSSSVGEHRGKLDEASRLLTSDGDNNAAAMAEVVVDVMGEVAHANQDLQSKLQTAERRLKEQAAEIETHISRSLTDALTGLPNRREFNARLEERMNAWARRQEVFSLMLLDVDHFKKLNDRHGHLAGDQVLAAIGRALRGAIRREDAVARYGGEEFAVLLPATSLDQAVVVAQKIREAVGRLVLTRNSHQITVTMSAGLATIEPNERVETLIGRADTALYAAKAAGRDCAFLHNGIDCQFAGNGSQDTRFANGARATSGLAARVAQLINGPDGADVPADRAEASPSDAAKNPPRDIISAELSKACQELRRSLEDLGMRREARTALSPR